MRITRKEVTIRKRQKLLKSGLLLVSCFIFALASLAIQPCFSLPEKDEVVSGKAEFQLTNPTTLTINADHNTIINYKSFDIMANETVIINLPDSSGAILNRVTGPTASQILGNLNCNGTFVLVNTNGINFGPNANVNVGSMIASTRDITNSNFLNARYVFERTSQDAKDSLILNQGFIKARDGGFVVLAGGAVENRGMIIANIGTITLAAGDMITVSTTVDGMISVIIDRETAQRILDKD
jgi:filamentous hemagglutinin family protein